MQITLDPNNQLTISGATPEAVAVLQTVLNTQFQPRVTYNTVVTHVFLYPALMEKYPNYEQLLVEASDIPCPDNYAISDCSWIWYIYEFTRKKFWAELYLAVLRNQIENLRSVLTNE